MGGVIEYLHVQHGGQPAQTLRADAQRVHLVVNLDAQFFQTVARAAHFQLRHINRQHQRFFRQQQRLFRRAADADAELAGRTPARAHAGQLANYPLHYIITGVEHGEARLVFRTTAFGRDAHLHLVTRHQVAMHHCGRVVTRVLAPACRVGHDGGAQYVIRIQISLAHTDIDHLGDAHARIIPAHVHAHAHESHHDAGVLAHGAMPLRAHARVGEYLRHRILGRRRFFTLIGRRQRVDVVRRMVIGDELQGISDAVYEILLTDDGHGTPAMSSCLIMGGYAARVNFTGNR